MGSVNVNVLTADILLKNYRSLECEACQQHFGYQSRSAHSRADLVYCCAECADSGASGPADLKAPLKIIKHTPKVPVTVTPPAEPDRRLSKPVEPNVVKKQIDTVSNLEGFMGRGFRKPSVPMPTENGHGHNKINSLLKEEEKPIPSIRTLKFSPNIKSKAILGVMSTYSLTRYTIGSSNDDTDREAMHTKLNEMKSKLKPYNRKPIIGEIVIGPYEEELYRAAVTNLEGESVKLEFIDYGDATTCKIGELFFPPDEILTYPRYGMNANLDQSRIKKLIKEITPEVEQQLYHLMPVEFNGRNDKYPDEYNVTFWIDDHRTLNELFDDKSQP
jgi:hypothetical protein